MVDLYGGKVFAAVPYGKWLVKEEKRSAACTPAPLAHCSHRSACPSKRIIEIRLPPMAWLCTMVQREANTPASPRLSDLGEGSCLPPKSGSQPDLGCTSKTPQPGTWKEVWAVEDVDPRPRWLVAGRLGQPEVRTS